MSDASQSAKPPRLWARRLGLVLGAALVLVSGTLVLGAHFPWVPHAGYGSLFLTGWPAWFVVAPLIGGLLVWQCSHRVGLRRIMTGIALATSFGTLTILWQVVNTAHRHNVNVSLGNAFGFSGSLVTVEPDEIVTYTRDAEEPLTLRIFKPRGPGPADGWPVLMHIHGGGWVEGSNEQQSADMRWYADRGWIVVSAGYVLSNGTRHMWDRVHGELGCAM
jgi:acetyl esterase